MILLSISPFIFIQCGSRGPVGRGREPKIKEKNPDPRGPQRERI